MAVAGISAVVTELQSAAVQAAGGAAKTTETSGSFAAEMKSALGKISDEQQVARKQAEDFSLGKQDVALNDVMVDLQKATIALQMGVQVRNKLVTAYQEVMSMQV